MHSTENHIYLRQLRFYAYHGVMPQERVVGCEYIVDVDVVYNFAKAEETDAIDDTMNYATLYEIIRREMAIPSNLLEHVIARIGQSTLDTFPQVEEVTVDLQKLNPPFGADCQSAGVRATYRR